MKTMRRQIRARKSHACDLCGETIAPRSEYIYTLVRDGSKFDETHLHIHCDMLVHEYLNDDPTERDEWDRRAVQEWAQGAACPGCPQTPCPHLKNMFSCGRVLKCTLPEKYLRHEEVIALTRASDEWEYAGN